MRRLAASAVVLLLAAAASAQDKDGEFGVRKAVADALARGDRAAALAALDAVIEPGAPRVRKKNLEGARAATDLVGGKDGDLRAARLVVDALKLDRSDDDGAYALAMSLRKRFWDVDLEAEQELLRGLVRIYPETLEFNDDLARQYRHAGLTDEARAQYEKIKQLAPSDRACRYMLAVMHELRGDVEAALKEYDDLIALRERDPQPELEAHRLKARLLQGTANDLAGARKAAEAGLAAAERSPPGRDRDRFVEEFKSMFEELDQAAADRTRLHGLRRSIDAAVLWTGAAWLVVLGGGALLLRRAKWI